MSEDSSPDATYGAELLEALKRAGHASRVTSRMDYAAIQKLKAADRQGTAKLFRGSDYVLIQEIKTKSPEEVVELIERQAAQQARAAASSVTINGALLLL